MTVHLPIVSVSEMRCFRRCNREHHISYELGYRAIARAAALAFGTLIHKGLEVWWSVGNTDVRLDAAITEMRALQNDPKVRVDEYELVKAEELLRGYHYRWMDDPVRTIAVEQEFMCALVNPATGAASKTYELGGKLDAIAEVPPGHPERRPGVYVVEHKTASVQIGLGSVYWQKLRLDSQVSVYYEGARSLGHEVTGCLYDVIRKPGIKPSAVPLTDENGVKIVHDASGQRVRTKDGKKWRESGDTAQGYVLQTRQETAEEYRARLREDIASNPDGYYQRGTVVRLEDEQRDAAFDTWQTARLIREAQVAKRHPRNPEACERYSRMCEFFEACCGMASLDDRTKFRKIESKHEELQGSKAKEANGATQGFTAF